METIKAKWSWGGAMFHVLYLALTRKYVRAVLVVIGLFIPFANFVVMVAIFILWGLNGNHWIDNDSSLTVEQRKTYTTLFDRIGYFMFLTAVVVIAVSIVIALMGGGFMMFNMMSHRNGVDGLGGPNRMNWFEKHMEERATGSVQ